MGAIFTENTASKIKRAAAGALAGVIAFLILLSVFAFAASRLVQSDYILVIMSAFAVFVSCAVAAFTAGGKIYGVLSCFLMLILFLIAGALFFKSGIIIKNALIGLGAGALGMLSGTGAAAAKR